jgi:hypothetical protein
MKPRTLAHIIASTIQARKNCQASGNTEWHDKHDDTLRWIEDNLLPSGSGIDCGTEIDEDSSRSEKIILTFSFHHMDENGMYSGWSDYKCEVTPSFSGIDCRIVGRDRNMIKDYLHETFDYVLSRLYTYEPDQTLKSAE